MEIRFEWLHIYESIHGQPILDCMVAYLINSLQVFAS